MNYALYISASGALNAMYRQDVLTGNLSNVNTAGFKPDRVVTRQRDPARVEDSLPYMPSSVLLERLGAGVMGVPGGVDFAQGAIVQSGNPLDVALRGDGFLTLLNQSGDGRTLLTRDGRLTLNAKGQLALAADGTPLANPRGRPIELDPTAPVTIHADGTIEQRGEIVASLALADVRDRAALKKEGQGRFALQAGATLTPATGLVEQFAVEQSAVNEIAALMEIEAAARDAQANLGMIAYQDRLLEQAISRFARVA